MNCLKNLVIGESHLLPKTIRLYSLLESPHGIASHFYIDDASGVTRKTLGDQVPNVYYAKDSRHRLLAWVYHWIGYIRLLGRLRPDLLEVYTSRHPLLMLPMVWLARLKRIPIVVVCRGELFYFEPRPNAKRSSLLIRWSFSRILRMASLIVYKEAYMPALLDRICPRTPQFFWHNAVPIGPAPEIGRKEDIVLFLNRFVRWRNVDLVVRSARLVHERVPSVRFLLVGKTEGLVPDRIKNNPARQYSNEIDALIKELELENFVSTQEFSHAVEALYAQAKIYLLLADLVYCNNALLEAMERGVPPAVSDQKDKDTRRIVEDGVSGLVVPLNEIAIADAIVKLLTSEDLRVSLAQGARRKIVEQYNLSECLRGLAERYHGLARSKSR
jgi:glycosyltransferase involved in cell wall biosynthesis